MTQPVYILGGYQTHFGTHYSRQGKNLQDLIKEVTDGTFAASQVSPQNIDVCHIGNFVSDLFAHQAHLGGLLQEACPELRGLPANRHEAACASGSMAIMAAMADIESQRYQCAYVMGVELMRNVDSATAAQHLGTAACYTTEAQQHTYCWPTQFSQLTDEYQKRYGIDQQHLAHIAKLNLDNAKRNPNAQTAAWQYTDQHFMADDELNPVIAGQVRRFDCSQITDGAAGVILANAATAKAYAQQHHIPFADLPIIKGWGHKGARLTMQGKLADSAEQPVVFPHVQATVKDALRRAKLAHIFAVDCIETHDCFSMSEYMAIDHFGITAPGESWKAIEAGWIDFDGKLPINPSGGLIGLGHPVGATGVRMLLDGYKQVTQQAGDYQIANANNVLTLNIGGSTATAASFIVGKAA